MTLRYRKKIIGAKIETTYGTDSTPGAADAVLATSIELTPLAGDQISRDIERPYYGASSQIQVNTHQQLKFNVELASSGEAGIAPGWGKLLRGCGLAETITADTKVEYTPISTSEESLTLYFNIDGQLHKLLGARGTFQMELNSNQIPQLVFTFTGLWADPSSVVAITPDFSTFQDPLHGSNENTPTVSLHGLSPAITAISYDHANEIAHRELIGADNEVLITNRNAVGSITLDAPALSSTNYFTRVRQGNSGAFALQHGKVAGGIVEFNAPAVQLNSPQYSEANGIAQLQMGMSFLPDNGNDEIKITAR